jgi:hypothetical protein
LRSQAAGPVIIGPRRRSSPFIALALTVGLAGCGTAKNQATAPAAPGAPSHGRVPADVRVLTVTRGYASRKPSLSATTTNAAKVAAIATMLDGLHRARPGVVNCPMIRPAPTVTFTFRDHRDGPALARASTLATGPDGECPGVTFKLPGRAREGLSARSSLLREAQRTLGVPLMTK